MNKKELIEYFKKQTHCPICNSSTNIRFDKRIDYITGQCFRSKITPHSYSFLSRYSKNGFMVQIYATLYGLTANVKFIENNEMNLFEIESHKQYDAWYDSDIKGEPAFKLEIKHPKEFYRFMVQTNLHKLADKLDIFQ